MREIADVRFPEHNFPVKADRTEDSKLVKARKHQTIPFFRCDEKSNHN